MLGEVDVPWMQENRTKVNSDAFERKMIQRLREKKKKQVMSLEKEKVQIPQGKGQGKHVRKHSQWKFCIEMMTVVQFKYSPLSHTQKAQKTSMLLKNFIL